MRLVEQTSSRLVIKASAVLIWILSGVYSLGMIILIIFMWVSAEFQAGQEIIGLSLLASIPLVKFLSGFRIPTTTATFDKTIGSLKMERKWLWKEEVVNYSLDQIQTVMVIRKGSFGKARRYFKIWLQLTTVDKLPLTPMNYRPENFVKHRANEIKKFLNLPYR